MSGSVLDRLNPLLEPDGELILSEKGLVGGEEGEGEVERVSPHPNFRLFMAMRPGHGEVFTPFFSRSFASFSLSLPRPRL